MRLPPGAPHTVTPPAACSASNYYRGSLFPSLGRTELEVKNAAAKATEGEAKWFGMEQAANHTDAPAAIL